MTDPLIKTIAIGLCVQAGHDPWGPTCDIHVDGDPDAGSPWAGYRPDARKLLAEARAEGMREAAGIVGQHCEHQRVLEDLSDTDAEGDQHGAACRALEKAGLAILAAADKVAAK